jgi:hypothetical protein
MPSGIDSAWSMQSTSLLGMLGDSESFVVSNLYFYANNDPIFWRDPSGLQGVPGYPLPKGWDPNNWPENRRLPACQLPYDPTYGPTPEHCSHYPGWLSPFCTGTKNNPYTNCVRKCIALGWPRNPPWYEYYEYLSWGIPRHPVCWTECQLIFPDDYLPR